MTRFLKVVWTFGPLFIFPFLLALSVKELFVNIYRISAKKI